MNIAHLLPYTATFPLQKHNGRYEWALRLAMIQAAKGHQVTIYSSPKSSGKNIEWKSIDINLGDKTANNLSLIKLALSNDSHDIYHSHFDYLHYLLADQTSKPLLATQHWFPNKQTAEAAKLNKKQNVYTIAPTTYMAKEDRRLGLPNVKVIRHGIDLKLFKPTPGPSNDRLVFIGRICKRKGVLEAVEIARAANEGLDIIGKVNNVDQSYWQKTLPYVDGNRISYLGPKPQAEVARHLAKAKAFIFPSQSREAFGQVTVEAQACGTPVIISDIGASKELVEDGKSGFVVGSQEEFIGAVKNISRIDRRYCRKFAENFDINKMVEEYNNLYEKLVGL